MRANEFINDDYNSQTVRPGFKKEKWYNGRYLMVAQARDPDKYDESWVKGLIIKVFDPKSKSMWFNSAGIASARFIVIGNHMEVSAVQVATEYQRQGIASAMYNFARELGNDVEPSRNQSDQGKAFWASGAGVGKLTPDQPPEPVTQQTGTDTPVKKKSFLSRLFKS